MAQLPTLPSQTAPVPMAYDATNFNAAGLDLAPQQPSRVRRAWERVPRKTKAPSATTRGTADTTTAQQREKRDRTVWKRPSAKPFQHETEHGGTGFAVHGSKRQRMKNMPAFPIRSGRGVEREQEAEATDDELFSRRSRLLSAVQRQPSVLTHGCREVGAPKLNQSIKETIALVFGPSSHDPACCASERQPTSLAIAQFAGYGVDEKSACGKQEGATEHGSCSWQWHTYEECVH